MKLIMALSYFSLFFLKKVKYFFILSLKPIQTAPAINKRPTIVKIVLPSPVFGNTSIFPSDFLIATVPSF